MAYGNKGYKNKGAGKGVRLTGLFKTKRNGLYVGSVNEEKIAELVQLIKKATKEEKEIVLFLWKSKYDDGPKFTLQADLQNDYKPKGGARRGRPIEDDDDDDAEDEPEDKAPDDKDDPFGDD